MRAFLSISLVFQSSPGSPTAEPRRKCFDVTITDDDSIENIESFSLLLQEDRFATQTGATISPNKTEINILSDDRGIQSGYFHHHFIFIVPENEMFQIIIIGRHHMKLELGS